MAQAIPDDATRFFEEFLPERFAEDRHRYRAPDSPGAALFEVTGVGAWSFRIREGELVVERGKPADTRLQIAISPDDFHAIFVERARREMEASGTISDGSRDAFRPLFVGAGRAAHVGGAGGTVTIRLEQDGVHRRLHVTPGAGDRTDARATIILSLEDFLALVGGRASAPGLAFRRRLGVRGDLGYALKLSVLLS
jgi:hypothetical protein